MTIEAISPENIVNIRKEFQQSIPKRTAFVWNNQFLDLDSSVYTQLGSPNVEYDSDVQKLEFSQVIPTNLKDSLVIAGGSVLNYIIYSEVYPNTDYDLFFIGTRDKYKVIQEYMEYLNTKFGNVEIRLNRAYIEIEIPGIVFQIILLNSETMDDIFYQFDISACKVCYYNDTICGSEDAIESLKTGIIKFNSNHIFRAYEYRLVKYIRKGFSLELPVDISKYYLNKDFKYPSGLGFILAKNNTFDTIHLDRHARIRDQIITLEELNCKMSNKELHLMQKFILPLIYDMESWINLEPAVLTQYRGQFYKNLKNYEIIFKKMIYKTTICIVATGFVESLDMDNDKVPQTLDEVLMLFGIK